jgi:hypothetical protein
MTNNIKIKIVTKEKIYRLNTGSMTKGQKQNAGQMIGNGLQRHKQ